MHNGQVHNVTYCYNLGKNAFLHTIGTGKRGHIVTETLLLMTFLCARKLGNICCGHKMLLKKIRNIFCVPDTKLVSATNVARAGKRGNICVGINVSATMCPRLTGPYEVSSWLGKKKMICVSPYK